MSVVERIQDTNAARRKLHRESGFEDMDILDKLGREHEEVQGLLEKLVDSESGAERTVLFRKVKAALVPHTQAEEKVVYDRVLRLKKTDSKIDGNEGYDEHELASAMLKKLSRIRNKTSPEFTAAAKVLKELVNHHVKEEESAVWSHVKENFSDAQRVKMNSEFEAAKKKVRVA
jgi:hemerythrin superfamily protein